MNNTIMEKFIYSPLGDGGTWFRACRAEDVPANGGVCVKYGDEQIALFHFTRRDEWYATQNLCLSGDGCAIKTYPVRVENDYVYIGVACAISESASGEGFEEAA